MHNSASAHITQSKNAGTANGNYWTLYQAHQALPASISTLVDKNIWNLAVPGTYQLVCEIVLGYESGCICSRAFTALSQWATSWAFGSGVS